MESVVCDEMRDFLLSSGVIPPQQHGFLPGRSTITNLLLCINDWTAALDNKMPVDVIYLDFCKAFDRVPTARLLHKLEHQGIRGDLLLWIGAFLKNRSFCVRIGDAYSSTLPVVSGVPQGSVLGPLLFLAYAADLVDHIHSSCSAYADDLKVYGDPLQNHDLIQRDLTAIQGWCDDWLLPLNVDKCVVLHVGKNNPRLIYTLCNQPLTVVQSHRDLGVLICEDLSWSEHITAACKKANSILYLLRKSFQCVSFPTFVKLYKCYVRPLLEYAGPVWSAHLSRDANLLESVQRRATRSSFGVVRPSYEERLVMSGLTRFGDRKLRGDLIITYRALHDLFSSDLSVLFESSSDVRLRGHEYKLKHENFKTTTRQHFISNRIFTIWNGLPSAVVSATSVNSFKNGLDAWLVGR